MTQNTYEKAPIKIKTTLKSVSTEKKIAFMSGVI